jgi:hypothetical protein
MRAVVSAVPVARIELERPSLEDVFVSIAGGDGSGPPGGREAEAAA